MTAGEVESPHRDAAAADRGGAASGARAEGNRGGRSGPRLPSSRLIDWSITLLVAIATLAWLLAVEGRQGFGRDEGQYMRAGERYWGWFEELGENLAHGNLKKSFAATTIDRYWSDNAPDHPVIMKTLYGLSWRAFHRCTCMGPARGLHPIPVRGRHVTLPLFSRESTAFRFPAMLFAAWLAAMVYRFARGWLPRAASVAASALTIAQPHYFFHAQIACFDAPITTMAFAVGFAYWKSLRSPRWGVIAGVAFGVALGVKHNAWLMPFFLVGHYLWIRRGDWRARRVPRLPLAFASMLVLGPIIFYLHWPWLWNAPVARTRAYVLRHLEHEHYNFEYLGLNWNNPPTTTARKLLRTTAPFVETLFTVPVTTLVLAGLGAVAFARRRRAADEDAPRPPNADEGGLSGAGGLAGAHGLVDAGGLDRPIADRPSWTRPGADVDRAPGMFLLVQILGPMAVIALPSTPIFGGIKHFMPALPYLAVLAAVGLAWLTRALVEAVPEAQWRLRVGAPAALALLVCLPSVVETRRSHPDGLSHYNLLAGGFAGGASLGMNRQFWGYSVLPMLGMIDAARPANTAMYWHDVISDALAMYKREGRLALDVGNTGFGEDGIRRSRMGILFYEKHWTIYEGWFWTEYATTRPVYVREREGVPLVTLYRRGP